MTRLFQIFVFIIYFSHFTPNKIIFQHLLIQCVENRYSCTMDGHTSLLFWPRGAYNETGSGQTMTISPEIAFWSKKEYYHGKRREKLGYRPARNWFETCSTEAESINRQVFLLGLYWTKASRLHEINTNEYWIEFL